MDDAASAQPARLRQRIIRATEALIVFSLLMYAVFAPHSIAITQGSFLLGLSAWAVQLFCSRNVRSLRSPLDIAILGFFACCVVSSFFSYDPMVSLKGLKSPAFFLAFYFVSKKVSSLRLAIVMAGLIVASSMVGVAYSAGQLAVGRGLRIESISPESVLARQNLKVGDVILEVDGQKVKTAEDISRIVDSQRGRVRIRFSRGETIGEVTVSRRAIRRSPGVGVERLGIATNPGRSFRVSGFYSHYETYAEVLQLIAALAFGLWVALPTKRSAMGFLLIGALALLIPTLFLTSTRAAMGGLAAGAAVISVASFQRRTLLITALGLLVLAPLAFLSVERFRGISFVDPKEGSTAYRLEVWQEALGMMKDHPLIGIGKGSEAKAELKEQFGLYDGGRLPPGHFHSSPIQIATWWGLPALVFYFSMMTIILTRSWSLAKALRARNQTKAWGLVLGGMGAVTAFNVSSVFHFNFGDGEVVMMFWLLTGLVFAAGRLAAEPSNEQSTHSQPPSSPDSSGRNRRRAQEEAVESSVRAAGVTQR